MTAQECRNQIMSSNPFMKGCKNIDKYNDYINSLLEALEKQIPRHPVLVSGVGGIKRVYPCPYCATKGEKISVFRTQKYCCNCGQKLDWSDAE